MKKTIVSLCFILSIVTIATCQTEKARVSVFDKTFTNPVWDGADPWMLKQGDEYFYCYSADNSILLPANRALPLSTSGQGYCTQKLKTHSANMRIWSKKGPVFSGNSRVFGVGHCSFVKSPGNSEDWIIYHSKKGTSPGWKRDVRMQPFTWNSYGTPNFGTPVLAG